MMGKLPAPRRIAYLQRAALPAPGPGGAGLPVLTPPRQLFRPQVAPDFLEVATARPAAPHSVAPRRAASPAALPPGVMDQAVPDAPMMRGISRAAPPGPLSQSGRRPASLGYDRQPERAESHPPQPPADLPAGIPTRASNKGPAEPEMSNSATDRRIGPAEVAMPPQTRASARAALAANGGVRLAVDRPVSPQRPAAQSAETWASETDLHVVPPARQQAKPMPVLAAASQKAETRRAEAVPEPARTNRVAMHDMPETLVPAPPQRPAMASRPERTRASGGLHIGSIEVRVVAAPAAAPASQQVTRQAARPASRPIGRIARGFGVFGLGQS